MKTATDLSMYMNFDDFREGFLDPLSRRRFERANVPLSEMRGWTVEKTLRAAAALSEVDRGKLLMLMTSACAALQGQSESAVDTAYGLLGAFFTSQVEVTRIHGRYMIEGWRCEPENGDEWDPILPEAGWDQPGIVQPPGIVALIVDLDGNALVRAIWEPGNVGRGWNESALLVDTSAKHSPGNKAMWAARGITPPLADFVDDLLADESSVIAKIDKAPYDGARDDKSNFHGALCASREEITHAVGRLDPRAQKRYALVSPSLLHTLNQRGLVPIHLRDLLSLLR